MTFKEFLKKGCLKQLIIVSDQKIVLQITINLCQKLNNDNILVTTS